MARAAHSRRRPRSALLIALALSGGLTHASTSPLPAQVEQVLSSRPRPDIRGVEGPDDDAAALLALYQGREERLLWVSSGGVGAPAIALIDVLRQAATYGLDPADYGAEDLAARLGELQAGSFDIAADAWEPWDLALSAAAMRFMRHLHRGRIEPALAGFDLKDGRAPLDLVARLEALATTQDVAGSLSVLEPPYHHYRLLKATLDRYRQLARVELPSLPTLPSRSVGAGDEYEGATALRRRLRLFEDRVDGEVEPGRADRMIDEPTAAALRRFQARHGLEVDGRLGRQTLAALNVSLEARVRQIELTLERWRWLPDVTAPTIVVNIPQFRLFAFATAEDREEGMLDMEVVVGESFPARRTPVFLGDLETVVFRPYWNVPPSIARQEILPEIRRDQRYLQRNHMELVAGWEEDDPVVPPTPANLELLDAGTVRVRQLPGPDNALGDIKFLLPNPYNVYLHSTPARALFGRARRDYSHGCIRVSDPNALAAYVLRDSVEPWTAEAIAAAMAGEPNRKITLARSIPVIIFYATVVATESGRVFFFDDLYGHDAQLDQLLRGEGGD